MKPEYLNYARQYASLLYTPRCMSSSSSGL